jgi:hypothetical protein
MQTKSKMVLIYLLSYKLPYIIKPGAGRHPLKILPFSIGNLPIGTYHEPIGIIRELDGFGKPNDLHPPAVKFYHDHINLLRCISYASATHLM